MKHALPTREAWQVPMEEYLSWLSAAKTPSTTMKLRSYHLRKLAVTSPLDPFEHTFQSLLDYQSTLAERRLSANTVRSVRTTLKSFYGWARHTGRMSKNPASKLPKVSAPVGKPRPAPTDAVRRGACTVDARARLMILLAAYAGLRCCEIARVHTDDLQQDLVGWSLIVHGKGRKQRLVPLPDELEAALRALPRGYVFVGNEDGHLSAAYVSKIISRALPPAVTAHMLRHWFASMAYVKSGNDIRQVQELLGHSSVATTQIYTAIDNRALRVTVRAVAA